MWEYTTCPGITRIVRTLVAIVTYSGTVLTITGIAVTGVVCALAVVVADLLVVLALTSERITAIGCTHVVVVTLGGCVFARLCGQVAFVTNGARIVVIAIAVLGTAASRCTRDQLIDASNTRLTIILCAHVVVIAIHRGMDTTRRDVAGIIGARIPIVTVCL